MLRIKYFVSCLQAAQDAAVFNEKPSREFWDTICTSRRSVSFANLKCSFAKSPLLSGQRVMWQQLQLPGRSLEVSLTLLALLRMQTRASPLIRQRTSVSSTFHRVFSKFQHNALHSFVFPHFKARFFFFFKKKVLKR